MGLTQPPSAQIYIPYLQRLEAGSFLPFGFLTVRTTGEPAGVAPAVRSALEEADRDVAALETRTMDEMLDKTVSGRRFLVLLMQLFAGLSLALAAVGVYGVMAYSVAQRTREIGVRIALGACRGDVLRLVVGEGARLVLVGIALGLLAAYALSSLMSSMLFGVSATDPAVYAGIALLLLGVALAACWVPALRATRVDPLIALRAE
jgi:putative ABC transport system permease protein